MNTIHQIVALWVEAVNPRPTNERGLSQSTENAILLAGAVAIAVVIITIIKAFVEKSLPK